MPDLDETHDPGRKSWVASANAADSDFPIQNLPFGVFSRDTGTPRVCVAIGDQVLDLTFLEELGILTPAGSDRVFHTGTLNPFMALGPEKWTAARRGIARLLDADTPLLRDDARICEVALVPQADVRMHLPFTVAGYTDFYASREHATNVGSMFRAPDNALLPNWLHIPIGYNGRASTVVVSGTDIRRPLGQLKGPQDDAPHLGPSAKLDFELELGAVVGQPSAMGQPITTAQAEGMIFGYVLLNDWSARDIQVWEYQPLGPFGSKAFGTTISPWIVTRDALAPFRVPTPERVKQLLPYLDEATPGNIDLQLEVDLRPDGAEPVTIAQTNAKYLYYSAAQQLTHHALTGCAMQVGDLLGSGTISGPDPESRGSLLELSWNGRDPVRVGDRTRTFLQDGDSVILRGWCEGEYRIGFGTCEGTILPATRMPSDP
ncbi:MAG: fumarylacetoacetase [Alphaproteobacteria bacterium]|nr:fumarylacetoacetase [Alphaproteobacteria bacterium]